MLQLPDVTLVCVDTRTPALGLAAMQRSMAQVRFGAALLFTDAATAAGPLPAGITGIAVQIDSVPAYSQFMLRGLAPHLRTPQHLIVQWDSWVLDARCWDPAFAACDYIGALFRDGPPGRRVGNGGFSLRSQRLLQALQDPAITPCHPEDACICIQHRERLERVHGIRFADEALAARFAFERVPANGPTFGFHGLFNLHRVLSPEALHALVQQLPPGMGAGMDVRDLARALVREGRGLQLDTAALLVAMRRANGLRDRRTRALQLRLALARCLRRGRQPQTK